MGSRVSEEAQRTGLTVVSISRSGVAPKGLTGAWVDRVQWTKVSLSACNRVPTNSSGSIRERDDYPPGGLS